MGRVIQRAAQQGRRRGLKGTKKDFASAINYLKTYRVYMDFAAGRRSDRQRITEAGCKVIFNQRLKQSGMRWRRETGQYIVDLRTAVRGGLWRSIWQRLLSQFDNLSPIIPKQPPHHLANSRKTLLLS